MEVPAATTATLNRFWAKVDRDGPIQVPPSHADLGPCHPWTKSTDEGYGTFWVDGARWYAHRWLWVVTHGPLPPRLLPDHRCHSYLWCAGGPTCPHRRCVNLRHLQIVTSRANSLRGCGPPGINARKLFCDAGHRLTGDNVYVPPRRVNSRYCRTCQALRSAAHTARVAGRAAGPGQVALAV